MATSAWLAALLLAGCNALPEGPPPPYPPPGEAVTFAGLPREIGPVFLTIDLPQGIGLLPGETTFGFVRVKDGKVGLAGRLPMVETSRAPLSGGGTRHAFSLGAAGMSNLRNSPEAAEWENAVPTVGFAACRNGPLPEGGPLVVTFAFRSYITAPAAPQAADLRADGEAERLPACGS